MAVSGMGEILYKTGDASYRVSAGAFFQVNRHLVDRLANLVTAGLTGNLALDFYAGVGLFSSLLAGSFAQVTAVEASQTSYADLLDNSPENVKAVCTGTEQYLQAQAGKLRADLVVVDPPRSGLGERVVKQLSGLKAPKLVYVSCDPSTLARDLRGLLDAGYGIEQAHLVDLFPQTFHLESVFHLSRK
jgi:23S rRNA (uracil1939-C5)-methyltransferase